MLNISRSVESVNCVNEVVFLFHLVFREPDILNVKPNIYCSLSGSFKRKLIANVIQVDQSLSLNCDDFYQFSRENFKMDCMYTIELRSSMYWELQKPS